MTTQDWLLGTAAVLGVVFAITLGTSRSNEVGASVAAAVAVCAALVPWIWTAWLERRTDRQLAWQLLAASLGAFAAAQIASAVVVIRDAGANVVPIGVDLLRLVGAGIGVYATVLAIHGRPNASRIERVLLIPAVAATSATAIFVVVLAMAFPGRRSDGFFDWPVASATITLPLSAALICWLAIVKPASKWDFQSARLALGWTCLIIVFAGAAIDRLLTNSQVGPRTDWAMLPAAALLGTSALRLLLRRADGAGPRPDDAGEADHNPKNWIRELAPYVLVAAMASVALSTLSNPQGWPSAIVAGIALLVAMRILVDQVVTQTRNRRAAKRLEQARLELANQASVDPVTGLPNRRALDDRLAEEVERALRYRQPLSLCFIDLDHFKNVNDEYGHAAGDAALAQVGTILRRTARGIDFVGRFGGEEFVVLVPGTWSEDAATLGERLRRAVAESTFNLGGGRTVRLTISVGIAGLPEHASDGHALNELADRALYAAKRAGRNQVVLFEPGS